jgi:hypothetical protein
MYRTLGRLPPRYSVGDRLFHRLALGTSVVPELTFDLERQFFAPAQTSVVDSPVYVLGLARSGTTILLDLLFSSGGFSSLTYRSMPFPLAPNLWKIFASLAPRRVSTHARAHGDGLVLHLDRVEEFEEVFWRTFGSTRYGPDVIHTKSESASTLERFSVYRNLVVRAGSGARYLSKNNNNVLRISDLALNPSARFVVAIRDPIETAISLYRQHKNFVAIQDDDPFVLEYMRFLGHHEFGRGHLPLSFERGYRRNEVSTDSLDYWLERWLDVYSEILRKQSTLGSQLAIVEHQELCHSPKSTSDRLIKFLGTAALDTSLVRPSAADQSSDGSAFSKISKGLYSDAYDVYTTLIRRQE